MKPLDIFLNESVVLKEGYFEDTEAVSEIAKKYGCRMFPKGFSDFLNNGVGTFLYATMTCMNKEELEACCAVFNNPEGVAYSVAPRDACCCIVNMVNYEVDRFEAGWFSAVVGECCKDKTISIVFSVTFVAMCVCVLAESVCNCKADFFWPTI